MPACVGGHIVKMFIVATVVNIFVSGALIFIVRGIFFISSYLLQRQHNEQSKEIIVVDFPTMSLSILKSVGVSSCLHFLSHSQICVKFTKAYPKNFCVHKRKYNNISGL